MSSSDKHCSRCAELEQELAAEIKNKKEFERDWHEACDQLDAIQSHPSSIEKGYQELLDAMAELQERIRKVITGEAPFVVGKSDLFIISGAAMHLRALWEKSLPPSATASVSPALAYQQAIRESVGSILSQYAADLILKRAEKIHEANNG